MFDKLAAWYFDVFDGEYNMDFKMWKAWRYFEYFKWKNIHESIQPSIHLTLLPRRLKCMGFSPPETQESHVHRKACLILLIKDKELCPYE